VTPVDGLEERAAQLRSGAPVQYNQFIAALEAYMWALMERCALQEGDVSLLRGQAQMCKNLVETMKKAGVKHG